MSESDDERYSGNDEFEIPPWDAASITQQRAEGGRRARDAAIRDLRASMSDEQIVVEFGIDLGQIGG